MAASPMIPPAGWFIIDDWFGCESTGKVISVLGCGALFCRFGKTPHETHRLIFPEKSRDWHFFETEDAMAAALNGGHA